MTKRGDLPLVVVVVVSRNVLDMLVKWWRRRREIYDQRVDIPRSLEKSGNRNASKFISITV